MWKNALGLLLFIKQMKVFTVCVFLVMLAAVINKPARPDSLPKTVWTYQVTTDNFVHSLCISRLKAILQESRWVLEILTPSNLFIYLHEHQEYKSAIRNHKELTFPQEMEIVKLLILKEYGGLWMDPNTILLDPVDWIQHMKNLDGIQNYGTKGFQMVVFTSVNEDQRSLKGSQQEGGLKMLDVNLAMLLALKASPVLEKWTKQLLNKLKKNVVEGQQGTLDIQALSLQGLSKVLNKDNGTLEDSLKANNVWKLSYNDFNLNFAQLANSQDPYILADFYIKFPLDSISSQLSPPKYFISLSQVETQLDKVLNPNVSKLAYLTHNDELNLFCSVQVNCAHYIEQNSIVYTYLLKDTAFEAQIEDMVNKEQRIFNECNENSDSYWLKYVKISIQYTFYLAALFVCFKVQKICLQLIWVKLKIFAKPKYLILKRILKTVKSVIQYESDNGI